MVTVFISHQKADTALSERIVHRLKTLHGIDCYLDTIDRSLSRGEDLAAHIRARMEECTQLLAVVSPATGNSQWVPWEIGVATEKNYPLATFSGAGVPPPEFLRRWPYMVTDLQLDEYAVISKATERRFTVNKSLLTESVARRTAVSGFYADLRRALRQ